jgi:hypothetical protein
MTVWLSRVRLRLAIWVPVIGLVWVGRAGHVTPALTAGAAVLLVSVLPWLWTAETYRNRAFRIGNRWAETVDVAHRQFQRAHEQRRRKLVSLTAPNQFAETHDRLLSLEVKPLANKNHPLVERTQKWIERQAGLERDLAALRTRASNGEQNVYVSQIDIHLSDSKNDYARMAAETERALSKAIEQIEHLHIPSKLATQHAELRHAYRDQFVAWNTYHQGVQASNLDAALRAVTDVEAATAAIHRCNAAIDHATRGWPKATRSTQAKCR